LPGPFFWRDLCACYGDWTGSVKRAVARAGLRRRTPSTRQLDDLDRQHFRTKRQGQHISGRNILVLSHDPLAIAANVTLGNPSLGGASGLREAQPVE
jgi:hypothetical protein